MTTPCFRPEVAIQVAADSIDRLRACDVFRALESNRHQLGEMVAYIINHRPDLESAVQAAWSEIQKERFRTIREAMECPETM